MADDPTKTSSARAALKSFAKDIAIAVVALFAVVTVAALAVWWGVKVFTWMP